MKIFRVDWGLEGLKLVYLLLELEIAGLRMGWLLCRWVLVPRRFFGLARQLGFLLEYLLDAHLEQNFVCR